MRDSLQKKIDAINSLIKIQDEMDTLHREYMTKMAEFNKRLAENPFYSSSTKGVDDMIEEITSAEIVEDSRNDDKEILALPVPETRTVTVPIKKEKKPSVKAAKKSVFDNPAFKEPYKPLATKNTTSPSKEENLPSFDEILSDGVSTKPIKCDKKGKITMEECLSGKPIDRILCAGILRPEYKVKQHERICLSDGIFPTITAGGNTAYVNV